jgi:CRP-like cAMP-binding protein
MHDLVIYLQQFKRLSPTDLELIRSKAIPLALDKGDYLSWKETEESVETALGAEMAFVSSGILRAVHVDQNGIEVTEYFIDEGHFVPVPDGNSRQAVSSPALRQALIKTELLVLPRMALEELSAAIPAWDQLFSGIKAMMEEYRIAGIRPTLAGDATACYKEFLDKFPQIAARIPLSYLASYLGITQQSFSRIRQRLAKNAYRPSR